MILQLLSCRRSVAGLCSTLSLFPWQVFIRVTLVHSSDPQSQDQPGYAQSTILIPSVFHCKAEFLFRQCLTQNSPFAEQTGDKMLLWSRQTYPLQVYVKLLYILNIHIIFTLHLTFKPSTRISFSNTLPSVALSLCIGWTIVLANKF